jgi:hypothetical protein
MSIAVVAVTAVLQKLPHFTLPHLKVPATEPFLNTHLHLKTQSVKVTHPSNVLHFSQ